MKRADAMPKSLTPQRKHRKLLKDGSGTEVWPESIEKIFVQGLREYWESPYATYSQSRGRSRWRNQFLVDYLERAGIVRSKKQVASHIQVLRNMWKGEPEFHLVAGGEELVLEPGQTVPTVKAEDHWDSNGLIPFDYDDNDAPSSHSASPDFSPPDFLTDFPPTPEHRPNMYPLDLHPGQGPMGLFPSKPQYSPSSYSPVDLDYSPSMHTAHSPSSPYGLLAPQNPSRSPTLTIPTNRFSYSSSSSHSSPITGPFDARGVNRGGAVPHNATTVNSIRNFPVFPSGSRYPQNRVTAFCLSAEGMSPLSIKPDALLGSSAAVCRPLNFQIKLSIPTVNDVRSPPGLHGFTPNLCLSSVWSMSGKCVTKVYANHACISEETGFLDVSNIEMGTVNVVMPDSSLNRCRWLDPSLPTMITQEIISDDETLLFIMYELDRRSDNSHPSAIFLGVSKHRSAEKVAAPPHHHHHASGPTPPPQTSAAMHPHAAPSIRGTAHASLSYALSAPVSIGPSNSLSF